MRIVPAFDELKNSQACLRWGVEGVAVEQLTFQSGEEALAEGIVVAISDGAHRRPDPGGPTTLTEGQGCVLAALVGMMDDTPGTTLADGHLQGIQDQSRVQVGGHRPTNHSAAPGIDDDRQI